MQKLYYYKDPAAGGDSQEEPAYRDEPCLNCGKRWDRHYNWSCPGDRREEFENKLWADIPSEYCYETQSMLDSLSDVHQKIAATTAKEPLKTEAETQGWRMWAADYNQPHLCKCGINRRDCDYHK